MFAGHKQGKSAKGIGMLTYLVPVFPFLQILFVYGIMVNGNEEAGPEPGGGLGSRPQGNLVSRRINFLEMKMRVRSVSGQKFLDKAVIEPILGLAPGAPRAGIGFGMTYIESDNELVCLAVQSLNGNGYQRQQEYRCSEQDQAASPRQGQRTHHE